jgi:hypothetical protein
MKAARWDQQGRYEYLVEPDESYENPVQHEFKLAAVERGE